MAAGYNDVAFTCDEAGVPYLCTSVWSLLTHYRGARPLRVNVLDGFGGHSEAARARLREVVARFPGAALRYVSAEPAVAPYAELLKPRAGSRWNLFTWTPIFECDLLPDVEGHLLHFDIDLLFNADVSPLFDLDLGGNLFGVVHEYHRQPGSRHNAVWDAGVLPPEVDRYFNTGVIVYDAAQCRAEQTARRIVAWYRDHYDIADRIEQDAYNALYHDRILVLPVRWNLHDREIKHFARADLRDRYWFGNPPRECLEAALDPAILHFWGPKKPWRPCHRPYRRLYHAAMRAVGLEPPREEWLAPWHNLGNALDRWRVRRRLAALNAAKP